MTRLPIFLDLHDQPAVVIGGGEVAERKAAALLRTGARVTVVSPAATPAIEGWAAAGQVRLQRRPYRPGDLRGARLAYAATDDPAVNQAVRREAEAERVWLNVADQPSLCDFITPALVQQGELTVAISTDGASPALARRIREELEKCFGPDYAMALERLGALRERCRAEGRSPAEERGRFQRIVDGLLPGDGPGAPAQGRGKVFLVGAGPGDPELLTLKGVRCLEAADVVVYDALVDERLLRLCPPRARRIYAGKRDGRHSRPQEEINDILIGEARSGRTVVRLKGGDPFIFGRGGEEAQALAQAGISYEVVPGVSAGIAVPAYAGVPLTHRDFTPEVTFLTGHERAGRAEPAVEWHRHARGSATLVIFMGLHNLRWIAAALMEHGRDPRCPVAVIQEGSTERQATVVGVLADIADRVEAAGLAPPAIIVVGEVVRLRQTLQWFQERGANHPAFSATAAGRGQ